MLGPQVLGIFTPVGLTLASKVSPKHQLYLDRFGRNGEFKEFCSSGKLRYIAMTKLFMGCYKKSFSGGNQSISEAVGTSCLHEISALISSRKTQSKTPNGCRASYQSEPEGCGSSQKETF